MMQLISELTVDILSLSTSVKIKNILPMPILSKHFSTFFKELAGNNNRDWLNANKQRFEEQVKAPFENLTAEVIAMMQKLDPQIRLTPKDAVFRIHRDTRFSADKDHSYPGLYFQAGVDGLAIAGGCWEPDKDRLLRIRKAIAANPKRIRKIFDNKKFKETFDNIGGDKNKIIPKEFQEHYKVAKEFNEFLIETM
jgi:uncharacterized protein (DUF2461 family)